MSEEEKIRISKDTHIQLLKETMWDVRDQRNFFKTLNIILCIIIFCLIGAIITLGVYNQKSLKEIAMHDRTQKLENTSYVDSH